MNPETMARFAGWTFITVGSVGVGLGAVTFLFTWAAPWVFVAVVALVGGLLLVIEGVRRVTRTIAAPHRAEGTHPA